MDLSDICDGKNVRITPTGPVLMVQRLDGLEVGDDGEIVSATFAFMDGTQETIRGDAAIKERIRLANHLMVHIFGEEPGV